METRRQVVLHLAERAEALGYDAFFLAEGWGHDAGVLLAEVATRTNRITIGTGILNIWGRTAASHRHARHEPARGLRRPVRARSRCRQPAAGRRVSTTSTSPRRSSGSAPVTRQVRRLLAGERLEPTVERANRPLKLAVTPQTAIPIYLAALGPSAIRLAGELADGWCPFLLPLSGLDAGLRLLEEGMARGDPGRTRSRPSPRASRQRSSTDPAKALEMASWWVSFYLVSMGPLYRKTLRRLGHGDAVDEVLAANPTPRTFEVPESARVLLDELTLWGDAEQARAALDRWYAAGAEMPTLTLPPGRPVEELDHILESMRP